MSSQMIDKAVILARGLGTRMRKQDNSAELDPQQAAIAATGVKALMPIDRPFLDYVLGSLADAGYKRICLVIGPEHDNMREHFGSLECNRISIEFAVQVEPLGTADAVAAVEQFAGDDHFLCINSDNYYPEQSLVALRELDSAGLAGFEREGMLDGGNIPSDRIVKFAVIKIDEDGNMESIIEKPDPEVVAAMPEPICLSMNCWRFGPEIFEACKAIEPSPRGELEIPDAVQYSMEKLGVKYKVAQISAPVLDMSNRGDIDGVTEKLAGTEVRL